MGLIGSMTVALVGDITGLDKELKKAKKNLDSFASTMTGMGTKLTAGLTVPIAAAGGAAFKLAADMEDAMGATDQIFGSASEDMKKWANSLESYYGIASSEALEYSNMMGSMLQNIGGLTEDEAAKQAQTLLRLAGDLTAMYGGTTADAVRALTGALKGNNTMLDNYGMAVNDAMIKTKAFEMGIYSGKGEMDLATKQAATLALIVEQTGAAQGQAAREAEGASGTMRAFATEVKNLAISFGNVLLPVITPIISRLGEMVKMISNLSPATQKTIVAIAGIVAAIGPVLLLLGSFASGLSSIIALATSFSGVLTAAGTTIGALAAPVAIAVAAVMGLGLAVKDLWQNNEDFRTGVIAIWEDIKKSFQVIIGVLQGLWAKWGGDIILIGETAWETVKTIISTVLRVIGEIIALALNLITGDFDGAWKNIINIFNIAKTGVISIITNLTNTIKTIFLDLIRSAISWGENMLSGFIQGIKNKWEDLKDAAKGIADTVSDFLGFSSPTKKGPGRYIETWGANMVTAFADGMYRELATLRSALSGMVFGLNPALATAATNNYGGNTIYITVNGNWSDIERELSRRGLKL